MKIIPKIQTSAGSGYNMRKAGHTSLSERFNIPYGKVLKSVIVDHV